MNSFLFGLNRLVIVVAFGVLGTGNLGYSASITCKASKETKSRMRYGQKETLDEAQSQINKSFVEHLVSSQSAMRYNPKRLRRSRCQIAVSHCIDGLNLCSLIAKIGGMEKTEDSFGSPKYVYYKCEYSAVYSNEAEIDDPEIDKTERLSPYWIGGGCSEASGLEKIDLWSLKDWPVEKSPVRKSRERNLI